MRVCATDEDAAVSVSSPRGRRQAINAGEQTPTQKIMPAIMEPEVRQTSGCPNFFKRLPQRADTALGSRRREHCISRHSPGMQVSQQGFEFVVEIHHDELEALLRDLHR